MSTADEDALREEEESEEMFQGMREELMAMEKAKEKASKADEEALRNSTLGQCVRLRLRPAPAAPAASVLAPRRAPPRGTL